MEVVISEDRNVIKKEAKKLLKYITPAYSTCGTKNKIDTSNNGHTGTTSKSSRKYLTGKHKMKDLRKAATFDIAHTLR
jgi:hypothetical protein